MKTRKILLGAAALAALNAMAEQRTETEALGIAQRHIAMLNVSQTAPLQLVAPTTLQRVVTQAPVAGRPAVRRAQAVAQLDIPYFVYNNPAGGYVVVSGTTTLPEVIASSATGSINAEALPDGLRYWLEYAAEAAAYAEKHPEAVAPHPAQAKKTLGSPELKLTKVDYNQDIAPMLENSPIGNIQWGQDAPFNDKCPVKGSRHCYTGCMATAMAQVMAYHQYPKSYDWSEILPSYGLGVGTSSQKSEVARLNSDVGVALHMEYGTDQSGSVSTQYAKALSGTFGYNENVALINRDNYTYGEWIDILLNEFVEGRPVVYDGVSNDGGHAFVLDGYRAKDGFFHVNWGWEGLSDGYYNIILLNPQETGIGAVLSSGFTSYQDAVVGIEPDRNKDINYYLPIQGYAMQGELVIGSGYAELAKGDRKGYISFQNMPNMKGDAFRGEFGALFVDQDGQIVGRAKAGTVTATASTMNSNPHATPSGGEFQIPELADGVYRVYCYIQDNATGNWAVARTSIDKPNFMTMTQANGRAFFEISAHHPTNLKVTEWSFENSEPRYGSTGLTVTITNEGDEIEYGSYALSVDVPNQLSRNFYNEFHRLLPGKSEKVTFPLTFDEYGEYTIRGFNLNRLNGGGQADIVEPLTIKFSVNRTLAETISLLNERVDDVQEILDRARLSEDYPAEACDDLQKVIDEVKAADKDALDIAGANALLKKLNDALTAFYKTQLNNKKSYWGYVNGKEDQLTSGWCPGGNKPAYLAISIPDSDLSAYIGGQIIGLRCLFGTKRWGPWNKGDVIGKVFLLDYDGVYPGDHILATSDEFDPTYTVYDEYLFNQPYTIGADGVLCVIEVTTPKGGGYYGAVGASHEVYGNGALWMNVGNGWEDMYNAYGNGAAGVAIQAIIVGGKSVVDGKLSNVAARSVAVGEEININGTFQNLSSQTIDEFEVAWSHDDDGQGGKQKFTRTVEPGGSTSFSLTVPGFTTTKLHTVRLSLSTVGGRPDQIAENSTVDLKVPVTAHKYVRNVVCEENTGNTCGYCPRGIVTFDYMKETYGDQFIGISIHHYEQSDPLWYRGDNYAPIYLYLSSAPSGILNRREASWTDMSKNTTEQLFLEEQRNCIAQIVPFAYYDTETQQITVTTDTEFGYDFSDADYRIAYAVLEDNLGPFPQTNYFAGGKNGVMGGWENQSSRVSMMYHDVLRELYPSYFGKEGSVPSKGQGGRNLSYKYSFALPSTVKNYENVRIVTMLIDVNTREILNAGQSKLYTEIPEGIDGVLAPAEIDEPSYDLSGRRLNTFGQEGLMIQGGKKVIR